MFIAGFISESFVDWRGKLVATVFTYGCNFRCPFCHNYTLVTEKRRTFLREEEILNRVKDLSIWIDGVCITGGEPTIYPELADFVKKLSKLTRVKLDTNGTNPELLQEIIGDLSYIAMDIKAPRARYGELAGTKVNLEKIEESIDIIRSRARDYEFRTTAVPVLKTRDFEDIAAWIGKARRYVLQQYSTDGGTLNSEFQKLKPLESNKLYHICELINSNFDECLVVNI